MAVPQITTNPINPTYLTNPYGISSFAGRLAGGVVGDVNRQIAAQQPRQQLPSYVIYENNLLNFMPDTTNRQMFETLKGIGALSEEDYNWFIDWAKGVEQSEPTWLAKLWNDPNFDYTEDFVLEGLNAENERRFKDLLVALDNAKERGGFTPSQTYLNQYGSGGLNQPGGGFREGDGTATPRPVFIGQPPTGGTPEQPYFSAADILVSATEQPNMYDTYDPYAPYERPDPYSGAVEVSYPYQGPQAAQNIPGYLPPTPTPTPTPTFTPTPIPTPIDPVAEVTPEPTSPLTFGGIGPSGPRTPQDVYFDLYDVNAMGTTPGEKAQIQRYVDMGIIDPQGRLLTDNMSRDDLYEMSIGGFGIGRSPLHESLIAQARAAFAGNNIFYNPLPQQEPTLVQQAFEAPAPQQSFEELFIDVQPETQTLSALEPIVPTERRPVAEPVPAETVLETVSTPAGLPQALDINASVPKRSTAISEAQRQPTDRQKGFLPRKKLFADGGIVSSMEDSPVTGQGIESFLVKYQSPEVANTERRAATLRRNLKALEPRPTAQSGIMPMARR